VKIIIAKGVMLVIHAKTMMTVQAITTVVWLIQRDFNGKCARQLKDKVLLVNLIKNAKIIWFAQKISLIIKFLYARSGGPYRLE
jgi:hypothetical protein